MMRNWNKVAEFLRDAQELHPDLAPTLGALQELCLRVSNGKEALRFGEIRITIHEAIKRGQEDANNLRSAFPGSVQEHTDQILAGAALSELLMDMLTKAYDTPTPPEPPAHWLDLEPGF